MRLLLIVVLALGCLWGGYWFVGANGLEYATRTWLAGRQAAGWQAEASSVEVHGFPNRFDLTLEDPAFRDPRTGFGYAAPFVQILALSYRPTRVIAAFAPTQTILTPAGAVTLGSAKMQASVALTPLPSLPLDHAIGIIDDFTLTSETGARVRLTKGRFAAEKVAGTETTYRIGLDLAGLHPAAEVLARVDPGGALPQSVSDIHLDATVALDRPLDRHAAEDAAPHLMAVTLADARVDWGPVGLSATGDLTVDAAGVPTGLVTVRVARWREMLRLAVAAGAVPADRATTLARAFAFYTGLGKDPETLEAPINFAAGQMSVGPIPLGAAPKLRLPSR